MHIHIYYAFSVCINMHIQVTVLLSRCLDENIMFLNICATRLDKRGFHPSIHFPSRWGW